MHALHGSRSCRKNLLSWTTRKIEGIIIEQFILTYWFNSITPLLHYSKRKRLSLLFFIPSTRRVACVLWNSIFNREEIFFFFLRFDCLQFMEKKILRSFYGVTKNLLSFNFHLMENQFKISFHIYFNLSSYKLLYIVYILIIHSTQYHGSNIFLNNSKPWRIKRSFDSFKSFIFSRVNMLAQYLTKEEVTSKSEFINNLNYIQKKKKKNNDPSIHRSIPKNIYPSKSN